MLMGALPSLTYQSGRPHVRENFAYLKHVDNLILLFECLSRWFEWDVSDSMEAQKLALKSSEQTMTRLEDVGLQLALTFNTEGSLLATGGEVENLLFALLFLLFVCYSWLALSDTIVVKMPLIQSYGN